MAISGYFQAAGRGTVGQLKDGSVIGTVRDAANGDVTKFGWKIRARYYKKLLIAELIQYSTNEVTLPNQEAYSVRGRETLMASNAITVALGGSVSLNNFATQAQLASIGLSPGMSIPVQPTDDEIPFELTADLHVRKKDLALSDADFVDAIKNTATTTTLLASQTGNAAPASTKTMFLGMEIDFKKVIQVAIVIGILVALYKVAQSQDWI